MPSAATQTTVLGRLLDPVDGLDGDAADRDQQQAGIDQRGQDRRPPVAIGVLLGRLLAREPCRAPCQQQRDHIGEIVNGIGDQRQRVRGIAEHEFGRDEGHVERHANRKRGPEIIRRVAVPGMAVAVRVAVMVVVMGHGALAIMAAGRSGFDRCRL
jgi:hypothetical protein